MSRIYQNPMRDIVREGAMVVAMIGHPHDRHHAILARGEIPPRQEVRLLVDTGAELSFINEGIARHLDLRFLRSQPIVGLSQKAEVHRVYAAVLHLGFDKPKPDMTAIPVALAGMREATGRLQFDGLLGRDFLADFDFAYSGPGHTFALRTDRNWPSGF